MAPHSLDMQISRVQPWQRVAREPAHHAQLLACAFGKLLCETTATMDFDWAPARSDGGDPAHVPSPWRKQFLDDVKLLRALLTDAHAS
eukprot:58162-Pyramimonas_sp.AAC.1